MFRKRIGHKSEPKINSDKYLLTNYNGVRINPLCQFSDVDVDYDLDGVDELSTIRGKVHQISAASSNGDLYQ